MKSGTAGVEFFEKLNGVDGATADLATTDERYARFIRVTTVDRSVLAYFVRAVGATATLQTSATATAGSDVVACEIQPLMMCNPFENTTGEFTANPGQMLHLKPKGSTGGFSPGDFGLLDPPGQTSTGAPDIKKLLSKQSMEACLANRISPRPGHATNQVADGINVRFDRPPGGNTSGMDLTVAPNVIDGTVPKNPSCKQFDPAPLGGQKLPRDASMTTLGTGVSMGNGPTTAQLDAYWATHWQGARPGGLTTRYDIYLRELGLQQGVDADGNPVVTSVTPPTLIPGSEPRAPSCLTTVGDYKRRLIRAAIVNCQHWNVRGNAENNIASTKYAEFFLTEPSPTDGGPEQGTFFVEFVRFVTVESSGGGLHRIVQLYR